MYEAMSDGFYDLCVNLTQDNEENLRAVLSKLQKLGFKTVAVNTVVDESILASDKKRKKKGDDSESSQNLIPEPVLVEKLRLEFGAKLKLLSRITFFCSDSTKAHILNHCGALKKYNLYAFAPKSQSALQFGCTQLNADVLTLKPSGTSLKLNKKLYDQAVERGIHFEIQYSDILDPNTRKLAIHYSHLFHTYGKSKNVIISSGASDTRTIRNPYDLINLSFILGLSEIKGKASILHQCKTLLLRAERRRRGKAAFSIEDRHKDDTSPPKKVRL